MPDSQNKRDQRKQPSRRTAENARTAKADADRLRRRATFLRERSEAKELRERVQPRRAHTARIRQAIRMRTFRW